QRRLVHEPGGCAKDRRRAAIERPRESDARSEVVLVDREVLGVRVCGKRSCRGDVEEIVPQPEQQLHVGVELPVVLNEHAVEVRVVADVQIAEVLLQGKVAERIGAALRREVSGRRREGVEETLASYTLIGDELRVDAGLEAVAPPDPGQVVDYLP